MAEYTLRDEGGAEETIEAEDWTDAERQAEEWLRDGDWDTSEGPIHVSCWVFATDEDGDAEGPPLRVTVTIEQPAPKCVDGQRESHDWQAPYSLVGGCKENPGVWGNGGGVIIREVCMRCGCARKINTWAHHPSTGEQGLTETTYEVDAYTMDEIEALDTTNDDDGVDEDGDCLACGCPANGSSGSGSCDAKCHRP